MIICIYGLNQIHEDSVWTQLFNKIGLFVNCSMFKRSNIELWIENQAKNMNIFIEKLACQLLCYYYENNFTLLKQILKHLSLIYPNNNLSFIQVKNMIIDAAYFNINHWMEAILTGNKKRANRILAQLTNTGTELHILLRKIQNEILIVIFVKYHLTQKKSLYTAFKEYKIFKKYHKALLSKITRRLSLQQLYQSIDLLAQIELKYKKDGINLSRSNFELLADILSDDNSIKSKSL